MMKTKNNIGAMQVAVYVMCGGGFLGRFAAEQPKDFYIDSRVGKLPYKKREIIVAVKRLEEAAIENGLNPRSMPLMPNFNNMGIF